MLNRITLKKIIFYLQYDCYSSKLFSRECSKLYFSVEKNIELFLFFLVSHVITWLYEINLTSLYKHRVFLVKSTGSLKSTGT